MKMYKTDAGHVADFKYKAGTGFICEEREAAAVVRYIQSLEAKIAQLVLENQPVVQKPMNNIEMHQAAVGNFSLGGGAGQPAEFTGKYGPDYGPGVAGCSDCEAGRCTMDCGGRTQARKVVASRVQNND